jgi:hypothetical protein
MLNDSLPGFDLIDKPTGQNRLVNDSVKLRIAEAAGKFFDFSKSVQQIVHLAVEVGVLGGLEQALDILKIVDGGNVFTRVLLRH